MTNPSRFNPQTLLLFCIFTCLTFFGYAQQVTKVYGKVIDASNGEPIAFADVGFVDTYVGTNTDDNGDFNLESRFVSDTLVVSFLGFQTQKIKIKIGERQQINVSLKPESYIMESVTVVRKKERYKKKNNPAIDLSRRIVDNMQKNHIKSKPYYSYRQHEKIKVDLNNITDKFQNRAAFKKFDYVFEHIDTSEINGRNYLPLFLKETLSKKFYRKSTGTIKEVVEATKYTEFNKELDANTIGDVMNAMYQDIDVYSDDMSIMEIQFASPLANSGPNYYRYYIIDTLEYKGQSVINLSFLPAVKGNRGFTGFMYVTNDGDYSVLKVEMGIIKNINLNFIRDLKIIQEYEKYDSVFIKTRDDLIIDYSLTDNGIGFFGTRSMHYADFSFEPPTDESIFDGLQNQYKSDSILLRSEEYWVNNRIDTLQEEEMEVYEMVNKLVNDPLYKAYVYTIKGLSTGYLTAGIWDFGVLATFFSFNQIEGRNFRIGGRSNYNLSKKFFFRGSLGHAKNTNLWKYNGQFTYTFNDEWKANPRHYLRFNAERTSSFPGQELDFFSPENFLLSFQRGRATDMLLENTYEAIYVKETSGFNYSFGARHMMREPYGTMVFNATNPIDGEIQLNDITTTEIFASVRWAPNEKFIQGIDNRTQLRNEYPIMELRVTQALPNVLNGDYSFTRAYFNIQKQFEWTRIGTTDMILDGGKTWGEVPYILQFIPRGNQTYANFFNSYNLMNFLEFSTDQYVALNVEHYSYGYFLNRVPLLKRLQLREIFGVKALYGSLSDKNNPNLNPDQIQFVRDEGGISTTYTMGKLPYIEASIGLSNILKVFRVDLIRRFTYLDNPRLPTFLGRKGYGLRMNFSVEF